MLQLKQNQVFPDSVDSSMLAGYNSCEAKWAAKHLAGITPIRQESKDALAGKAFAAGMEAYRKCFYSENNHEKALSAAILGAMLEMGETELYQYSRQKSPFRILDALYQVCEEFYNSPKEFSPILLENGKPAVEWAFSIELPKTTLGGLDITHPDTGLPLKYTGVIDAVVEILGMVYPLDDKTTKAFTHLWEASWEFRSQFIGYVWALQKAGIPSSGVYVLGTCFPTIPEYFKDFAVDHLQKSVIVHFDQKIIDRWYEQLLLTIYKMLEAYRRGKFFTNYESCSSYGAICAYKSLCLENDFSYSIKYWNPLNKGIQDVFSKLAN